jgi:ankyrin repeat protein
MPNVYSKMMPVIDNKIETYENKWFRMAYYGNGKPEDIVRMVYYGNGKPEDIEDFLLKINKPLHNKIFNKKWHPKTALEIAVYNGNYKYVRDLIKLGATVTLKAVKLCERLCENICGGYIIPVMLQELTYNIDYHVYKKYYTKKCWTTTKDVHVMNIVENVRDHLTTLKIHRRNYKNGEYEETFEVMADFMNRVKNIK